MIRRKGRDRTAIAEASTWAARLRSDDRGPDAIAEFRRWLAADDENVAAFEIVTDAWDLAGGADQQPGQTKVGTKRHWRVVTFAGLLAVIGVTIIGQVDPDPAFATAIGERRAFVLSDGTRVMLNTDTRLVERFSGDRRSVVLEKGEASFQVSRDARRPFVVTAGRSQVVATGTTFDIRWTAESLSVTLAEGQLRVLDKAPFWQTAANGIELKPGQRLSEPPEGAATIEKVDLTVARAWRVGRVVFDETPLTTAVAEMNRYGSVQIQLNGRGASRVRVSGAFKAGDSAQFARAVSELFGFHLTQDTRALVISPNET